MVGDTCDDFTLAAAWSFDFRIRFEEETLIEEFGDAYHEYRKRTKNSFPMLIERVGMDWIRRRIPN